MLMNIHICTLLCILVVCMFARVYEFIYDVQYISKLPVTTYQCTTEDEVRGCAILLTKYWATSIKITSNIICNS